MSYDDVIHELGFYSRQTVAKRILLQKIDPWVLRDTLRTLLSDAEAKGEDFAIFPQGYATVVREALNALGWENHYVLMVGASQETYVGLSLNQNATWEVLQAEGTPEEIKAQSQDGTLAFRSLGQGHSLVIRSSSGRHYIPE